jgi:PEP-CTERM motif
MSQRAKAISRRSSLLALLSLSGGVVVLGQTNTGSFNSPSTTAFLSVDLNGGPSSATSGNSASPTEGWNQSFSAPAFGPDPYGVTWSAWGGPTGAFGDGTQLPNDQSGISVGASSINKTFTTASVASGSVTATISAAGTSTAYGAKAGGLPLDSRDRGTGWTGGAVGPAFDIDMWRDFIFASGSGSNVQSSNFLQVQFTGLNPNSTYQISLYTYDPSGSHNAVGTATPYQDQNFESLGWWANQTANPGNETFAAPADAQVASWAGSGTPPAPITLNVISNGQGLANVWTWGGTGNAGDENADTSYLNGFQVGGGTKLLLGDTNGDGKVDGTDLATLVANMGQSFNNVEVNQGATFTNVYSRGYAIGDFNGDGVVNQDDFALYQLGAAEYTASGGLVPEPASIAMIALGSLAVGTRSRRR